MGYDLHITRKEFWADDEDPNNISLDEWKHFIKLQVDMRLDNFAEAKLEDGSVFRHESDGIAVWTSYSRHGKEGNYAWFNYNSRGEITIKNPDDELLKKTCSIAVQLNAFVQGDDGELYENGELKN